MSEVIHKADLIRMIYYTQNRKNKIQKFVLEDVFSCMCDAIGDAMVEGKTVEIRGFGSFYPIMKGFVRHDHLRNPYTGERLNKKYKFYGMKCFRASKKLYRKVNLGGRDVFKAYFDGDSTSGEY